MASRADVEAGKAFVSLYVRDSELVKGLNRISKRMQTLGSSIARFGGLMTAAGAGIVGAFIPAIKAASDMEETMSKFNIVFGTAADSVRKWGDEYAAAVGRSNQQIAAFLAGTQDLFVPLGFSADAAEALSKQVTQLAVDLGSFNNVADEDAMRDLQAALTGSGETMKKYGVIVNEAAVKQEILNQKLDPQTATEAQKVQARLNIIMRGTTAAQGDAIRTAGGFANQMKRLQAMVSNAAVAIGGALLPYVTKLVSVSGTAVKTLTDWVTANKGLVVAVAGLGAALAVTGGVVLTFGLGLSAVGAALGGLASVLGVVLSPLGLLGASLGVAAVQFVRMHDGARAVAAAIGKDLAKAWGDIRTALQSGDLALAAQVGLMHLRLAVAKALSEVSKQLTGVWSEALDDIAARIAAGDVAGAWETTVGGMTIAWSDFISTAREAWGDFTTDVKAFMEWMEDKLGAIADLITRTREAVTPGLMKEITTRTRENLRRSLENMKQTQETPTASTTAATSATPISSERLARAEEIRRRAHAGNPMGFAGETDAMRAFRDRLAARSESSAEAIAGLERELEELRKTAKETEERVKATATTVAKEVAAGAAGTEATGAEGMPVFETRSGGAAASFSSAALRALGQGGSPLDRVARAVEAHKKIAEETRDATKETRDKIGYMERLLTMTP